MLDIIKDLVKSNPGQLSIDEYTKIYDTIKNDDGLNVLIFGIGNDSFLWQDANKNGRTVFLENSREWIDKIKRTNDTLDVREIEYTTNASDWKVLIDDTDALLLNLSDDIINTEWDYIFVDSPLGGGPGRMQSIYTASTLKCEKYFLHDADRVIECTYGDLYLGKCVETLDRLKYYEGGYNAKR